MPDVVYYVHRDPVTKRRIYLGHDTTAYRPWYVENAGKFTDFATKIEALDYFNQLVKGGPAVPVRQLPLDLDLKERVIK